MSAMVPQKPARRHPWSLTRGHRRGAVAALERLGGFLPRRSYAESGGISIRFPHLSQGKTWRALEGREDFRERVELAVAPGAQPCAPTTYNRLQGKPSARAYALAVAARAGTQACPYKKREESGAYFLKAWVAVTRPGRPAQ